MKASRSAFLYRTKRPILTKGRDLRPVHFQTASVCSATPRYAAASLRVKRVELAGATPKGVCSLFFIGLILKCLHECGAQRIGSCTHPAAEEKTCCKKRSNQQNDLSAKSIFDVD